MALPVPRGPTYRDTDDKRKQESRNGYVQAEYVVYRVEQWNPECQLTVELLCELQRLAVNQIYSCARHLRDGSVSITNSSHGIFRLMQAVQQGLDSPEVAIDEGSEMVQ